MVEYRNKSFLLYSKKKLGILRVLQVLFLVVLGLRQLLPHFCTRVLIVLQLCSRCTAFFALEVSTRSTQSTATNASSCTQVQKSFFSTSLLGVVQQKLLLYSKRCYNLRTQSGDSEYSEVFNNCFLFLV
jgi:hypothetical protein